MNKIKIPVSQEHLFEGFGSCRQQGCVTSLKFLFNASLKKKMHKSRETIDFSVEPKKSQQAEKAECNNLYGREWKDAQVKHMTLNAIKGKWRKWWNKDSFKIKQEVWKTEKHSTYFINISGSLKLKQWTHKCENPRKRQQRLAQTTTGAQNVF